MMQAREDADFVRYRERGDADAMARVFDAVAPRLLLVAAHISRDATEAEDLVQTTFLQVIQQAERYDATRPLLSWMLGILAHRALDAGRRASVRLADSVGDVEDALDPAQLVLDAELREEVARTVDVLDEPYREVVLLRFLHGLQPTQIAHTLGRSPGTVRVQLQRGLERLRRALPRGLTLPAFLLADGGNWEELRREVLEQARGPQWELLPSAGIAKAVALVCAVLAVPLVAWSLLGAETREVPTEEPVAVGEVAREGGPALTGVSAKTEAAIERMAVSPLATESTLTVTVIHEDGTAAPDVGVHVRSLARASLGTELRTNAAGGVEFPSLMQGDHLLELDRWSRPPLQVTIGGDEHLELVLPPGSLVEGFVVDRGGDRIAGADIYFLHEKHPDRLMRVARSDERGEFAISDVGEGELIARAEGYQPSSSRGVRMFASTNQRVRVILQLASTRCRLHGRVLDAGGQPVPHASIQVLVDEDARKGGRSEPDVQRFLDTDSILLRADADGAFTTFEVPAGPLSLIARPLDMEDRRDGRLAIGRGELSPGGDLDVELVLGAGAEVIGRITDMTGQPAQGLLIEAEWKGLASIGQPEDEMGEALARSSTRTLADGSYRLAGLVPGITQIEVRPATERRILQGKVIILEQAASVRWDASIALPTELQVQLIDPRGNPLVGWIVRFGGEQESTDAGGRCRLTDLQPQSSCMDIFAKAERNVDSSRVKGRRRPRWPGTLPVKRLCDVAPREEELVVQLAGSELPTSSITGTLHFGLDPPADAKIVLTRDNQDSLYETGDDEDVELAHDGGFLIVELSSGIYRLGVRSREYGRQSFGPFYLPANKRLDVGSLVVEAPALLEVRLRAEDGGPIADCVVTVVPLDSHYDESSALHRHVAGERLRWLDASGRRHGGRATGASEIAFGPTVIAPGEHLIVAEGGSFSTRMVNIALQPGESLVKPIVCVRGQSQPFQITLDQDPEARIQTPPSARIHFYIQDECGWLVVDRREEAEYAAPGRLEIDYSCQLLPGRYHARFEDHRRGTWSGAFTEFDFEVPDSDSPAPIRVEISLP